MGGRFITFEGLDGSGKSTHLKRAAGWLRDAGVAVSVTHEPGGTPLGEAIRSIFLDPGWSEMDSTVEALLVFASRRQHLLEVIEPELAAGRDVLCDRFTDSTVVYQGWGGGTPIRTIREIERIVTGARTPDLTLLFDLPPEEAHARRHRPGRSNAADPDRFDKEELAFYARVREGYRDLVAAEPDRAALPSRFARSFGPNGVLPG